MLVAHQVHVRATATGPLELRDHTGASLRGSFFYALWERFCTFKEQQSCAECPLVQACPVSTLVAPLRHEPQRGRDWPRPFAIRPPVGHGGALGPGERFEFGLTLFGQATHLFPYVALALHEMGHQGVGRRVAENRWARGQFRIQEVCAVNPLTHQRQILQPEGGRQMATPTMPITWDQAIAVANRLDPEHVTLEFQTPLRLIDQERPVRSPALRPLVQRLLERHDHLSRAYGGEPFPVDVRTTLTQHACQVQLINNQTQWIDVASYSARQRRKTPIGGLVGRATYAGALTNLLPLLVWGGVLQVGKDTTKGNGLYAIIG